MRAILFFLFIFLCIGSVMITTIDLVNRRYFREFENIRSLDNPETYMNVDYLLIEQTFDRNQATGDVIRFDIRGVLLSDSTTLTLKVGFSKYIDFNLEYQPLYRSKLTGDYFLKNAPNKYYEGKYRNFYALIALKMAFFLILPFIIFKGIKFIRNRKYRL